MPHHKLNIDAVTSVDYKTLKVTSTAFVDGAIIPTKYTYDGENVNPPLNIKGAPEDTQCLVIIMEDLDAPIRIWKHWLAWNIHSISNIKELERAMSGHIIAFGELMGKYKRA